MRVAKRVLAFVVGLVITGYGAVLYFLFATLGPSGGTSSNAPATFEHYFWSVLICVVGLCAMTYAVIPHKDTDANRWLRIVLISPTIGSLLLVGGYIMIGNLRK